MYKHFIGEEIKLFLKDLDHSARRRRHAHLFEASAEPLKHSLHVASLLHGYDPRVVLLVDPDQEVLLVVVPETVKRK